MAKKRRTGAPASAPVAASAPPLVWLIPAGALLPAILLAAFSLPYEWFTNLAGFAYARIVFCAAWLNAAAAVVLLWSPLRERVAAALDSVGALPRPRHAAWLGIIYAGLWSFFFYVKVCQFRGFQLPGDTAATLSMAYGFLRGFGFENSYYGVNNFAIHFQPIIMLYAPFLLFGGGTFLLLAAQCAVIAAAPIGVYALIFRRTHSASAALAGLWLCTTSPFLLETAANNLETHVNLAAFFLWTMYFAERRRWLPTAALFVLAAMSNEHSMFAFFGVGLYLILRRPSSPEDRARGAALCAGTAALFSLEMLIVYSFPAAERLRNWPLVYGHLGATPWAAAASAVSDPWRLLKCAAWPPDKLRPFWGLLWSTGYFCLWPPAAALAWFFNELPFFLAAPGSAMQTLSLHYSAQVTGPVWWAMTLGMCAAFRRLERRGRTSWLLVWALAASAANFAHSRVPLIGNWEPYYFKEGPAVADAIPPDAAVWAPEYLTPRLGVRRLIRPLSADSTQTDLERHGFMPDYIVFDTRWFAGAPVAFRRKMAALIARESYDQVLDTHQFIVFKHPHYPLPHDATTPPFELPPPQEGVDFNITLLK